MVGRVHAASVALALAVAGVTDARAVEVWAHRGCGSLAPEQSMAAFERCAALGVDGIELDLQATRDGVLVAWHDQQLDGDLCRRPDGGLAPAGPIAWRDWAELADVRCRREPLVRFDAVLAWAAGQPGLRVVPEVKLQDPAKGLDPNRLAELVVEACRAAGMTRAVQVQSFVPAILAEIERIEPSLVTIQLLGDRSRISFGTVDAVAPRASGVRRELVHEWTARGLRVVPWVVDDADDLRTLASWGVHAVMTDRPDVALRVLPRERREPAPQEDPVHVPAAAVAAVLALQAPDVPVTPAPPAVPSAPAAATTTPPPPTPAAPTSAARRAVTDVREVRIVAVYPFTSDGKVDTFGTTLFIQEARDAKHGFPRVIDPYELRVVVADGEPFFPQAQLQALLEDGARVGADAIVLGEGRWYSGKDRWRMEVRMIDVVDGRVLWQAAAASGPTFSGPSAKKEVARKCLRNFRETTR